MHDFAIALAFVALLISPCVAAWRAQVEKSSMRQARIKRKRVRLI